MFERFHDGFYNGLVISDQSVDVFVATGDRERFVVSATGVVALFSGELRSGNIIFDVELRTADEIGLSEIREVYAVASDHQHDPWVESALAKSRSQQLSLLEINPSYGGNCLVLAKSFHVHTETEWTTRFSERRTNA
ncbi:MAG TPA: hypothetical protein VKB38_23500 [Terracidiphilus sp.]|nr:hypothetical protein [Terracidiphilus sp.]